MKRIAITILISLAIYGLGYGQNYNDFIGAGHNAGMTVTASSSVAGSGPEKTLDGSGMDSPFFAAGRFLNHATFGATKDDITDFRTDYGDDYGAWIDDQFLINADYTRPQLDSIWDVIYNGRLGQGQPADDIFGPYTLHFNYTWWHHLMHAPDILRHKTAFALSQILVISSNSDINDWAEAQSFYYDLLLEHAFGNYRDLLLDVTYSLPMGYYLSHYNNNKSTADSNPDENYAREIMQLFTIGLYELNMDGTRKLDASGNFIPTYGQDDIREMAQVFTGLGPGNIYDGLSWPPAAFFGLDLWAVPKDSMMRMYEDNHDTSSKELLNGYVIPANQPGDMDIQLAVDHLFNHPNVGPFVALRLIQRFVKSNPTPAYIERVAMTFNDNGSGVRGDMKALIKAILTDEEAREGEYMLEQEDGRLREPMLRHVNFAKGVGIYNQDGRYWNNGYAQLNDAGQNVLGSPTVFNFFAPDYAPNGQIKELDLVAPEFSLHNTSTAVTLVNSSFGQTMWGGFGGSWEQNAEWNPWGFLTEDESRIYTASEWLYPFADDSEQLLNEIDKVLTFGQLSDATRTYVKSSIETLNWPWDPEGQREYRTKLALLLIQMSPDYAIIK